MGLRLDFGTFKGPFHVIIKHLTKHLLMPFQQQQKRYSWNAKSQRTSSKPFRNRSYVREGQYIITLIKWRFMGSALHRLQKNKKISIKALLVNHKVS